MSQTRAPADPNALRTALEAHKVQFIAVNSETSGEIVGGGVRWRPDPPRMDIKIL